MKPYYQDVSVKIYHADCREVLATMKPGSVDLVLTDPPYGEGLQFSGDTSPASAVALFVEMLRALDDRAASGTYMACFWTMRSLDLLMDGVRSAGWSYLRLLAMHVRGNARPHLAWLPRLQPIMLCRFGSRGSDLHDRFSVWLAAAIQTSGLSNSQIAARLACDSRLVMKWSRRNDPSWCLPTKRFYPLLKRILHLDNSFDDEIIGRQRFAGLRPDQYQHDLYTVTEGKAKTSHPAEKPISVISSLCRGLPGDLILDPFMGSGTTLRAAKDLGRKAIGIEIEERYCEIAAKRMAQTTLGVL